MYVKKPALGQWSRLGGNGNFYEYVELPVKSQCAWQVLMYMSVMSNVLCRQWQDEFVVHVK